MGRRVYSKCLDCGETFITQKGGGIFYRLLHCDKCGRMKAVGLDKIDETFPWRKGTGGTRLAPAADMRRVRRHVQVEPISEVEYDKRAEAYAGKCRCRGKYKLDAPSRCPKCRSIRLEEVEDGMVVMCD